MLNGVRVRPCVLLPLTQGTALLPHYVRQGELGAFFAPGRHNVSAGARVDIEIAFARECITFHTRGIVRWSRRSGSPQMPAGVLVELASSERRTRDLLLDFAAGQVDTISRRRARRYPFMVPLQCSTDGFTADAVTDDLSCEGASLLVSRSLPVGATLRLRLEWEPRGPGLALDAEARWSQSFGRQAIGVRFLTGDTHQEDELRRLIQYGRQLMTSEPAGR